MGTRWHALARAGTRWHARNPREDHGIPTPQGYTRPQGGHFVGFHRRCRILTNSEAPPPGSLKWAIPRVPPGWHSGNGPFQGSRGGRLRIGENSASSMKSHEMAPLGPGVPLGGGDSVVFPWIPRVPARASACQRVPARAHLDRRNPLRITVLDWWRAPCRPYFEGCSPGDLAPPGRGPQ